MIFRKGFTCIYLVKSIIERGSAKIWLDTCEVFSKGALSREELALAVKLVEKNKSELIDAIELFRRSNKIKTVALKLK